MWWGYVLIGLIVLWILFDGFNGYRAYLEKKIRQSLTNKGRLLVGEACGKGFHKTTLIMEVDSEGKVTAAKQIYSSKFFFFPRVACADEMKERTLTLSEMRAKVGTSLLEEAFCNVVNEEEYKRQTEQLSRLDLLTEPFPIEGILEDSRLIDTDELEKMIKKEGLNIETLNRRERILLRYLLLKMNRNPEEIEEGKDQNECERL